jgi:hypothetical protein
VNEEGLAPTIKQLGPVSCRFGPIAAQVGDGLHVLEALGVETGSPLLMRQAANDRTIRVASTTTTPVEAGDDG